MGKDEEVTQDEFDRALVAILRETSAEALLQFPGVYEALAEHLNNDAIERARLMRDEPPCLERCAKCGGVNVEHAHWVGQDEFGQWTLVNEPFGSWGEVDATWCSDCGEHEGFAEDEGAVLGNGATT